MQKQAHKHSDATQEQPTPNKNSAPLSQSVPDQGKLNSKEATFGRGDTYGEKQEPATSARDAGGMRNEGNATGTRPSSSTDDGNR
jgi:hypothetical protein